MLDYNKTIQKVQRLLNSSIAKVDGNIRLYQSNTYDFKSLAPNNSVSTTITLPDIKYGLCVYEICHCGASHQDSFGGYWLVKLFSVANARDKMVIPMPKVWDSAITGIHIIRGIRAGTYTTTYENHTEKSTDSGYTSRVRTEVLLIR